MKNLKISAKIILVFLSVGIIGIAIVGALSFTNSRKALLKKSYEQLVAIREIKKIQIQNYFSERIGDMKVYAYNTAVQMAAEHFIHAYDSGGIDGNEYQKWESLHGSKFKVYIDENNYYDLLIISPNGDIVYSVDKEADLGQNVLSGSLANTGMNKAFIKGKNDFSLTDFSWYAVSDEPAGFVSGPIKSNEGELIGVLVYQLSTEAIDEIMLERSGMGETGETYLVGEDKLMRSDSYLDPEYHSVKASFQGTIEKNGVNTAAVINALAGQTNAEIIIDYNGNPVLSAYTPLNAEGLNWVLLAEIDQAEVMKPIRTMAISIFALLLVIGVIIVIISLAFARSISRPLIQGVELAKLMADGDLSATIDIQRKDEIGILADALRNMVGKISDIVINIKSGAENISNASLQISSTSQQLSQGANEQASSVEEVTSTMEQMTSNIEQNTGNAQQTEKIAFQANEGMKQVSERASKAVEANKEIAGKITIINDIAFQTNILALNAAVEAARAGEHGKGFAVVAAEVRKLAERSKVAAEEIVELAQRSLKLAEDSGVVMVETIPQIENTKKLVQEIAAASTEQNNGAIQVSNAMQQLNNVTQQSAAASEELATSAEEMASQAEQLTDTISFFKTNGSSEYRSHHSYKSITPLTKAPKEKSKPEAKKEISFSESDTKDNTFEPF